MRGSATFETAKEQCPTSISGPLRTLMTGYQIWGERNECAADDLSDMFRISTASLLESMRYLARDGLVRIDDDRRTLSLTDAGARAMALLPAGTDS